MYKPARHICFTSYYTCIDTIVSDVFPRDGQTRHMASTKFLSLGPQFNYRARNWPCGNAAGGGVLQLLSRAPLPNWSWQLHLCVWENPKVSTSTSSSVYVYERTFPTYVRIRICGLKEARCLATTDQAQHLVIRSSCCWALKRMDSALSDLLCGSFILIREKIGGVQCVQELTLRGGYAMFVIAYDFQLLLLRLNAMRFWFISNDELDVRVIKIYFSNAILLVASRVNGVIWMI